MRLPLHSLGLLFLSIACSGSAPAPPQSADDTGAPRPTGPGRDAFGIEMLYPTAPGGLAWASSWASRARRFSGVDPDDAWFDAAYATESLEHAVEIEAAVREICRVVRPGGRIVVIDKNVEQAGRLTTPEWEKWFGRRELEALLARHCKEVSSEFISYWADVAPDGLFLAWKAAR